MIARAPLEQRASRYESGVAACGQGLQRLPQYVLCQDSNHGRFPYPQHPCRLPAPFCCYRVVQRLGCVIWPQSKRQVNATHPTFLDIAVQFSPGFLLHAWAARRKNEDLLSTQPYYLESSIRDEKFESIHNVFFLVAHNPHSFKL